eukprot:12478239-Prorocentrum_lima.AAC.1
MAHSAISDLQLRTGIGSRLAAGWSLDYPGGTLHQTCAQYGGVGRQQLPHHTGGRHCGEGP